MSGVLTALPEEEEEEDEEESEEGEEGEDVRVFEH